MRDDLTNPLSEEDAERFGAQFKIEGYLAPSMALICARHRRLFPNNFQLAEDFNRLAQRLYTDRTALLKGRSTHEPLCVAIQIMPRALSAYQGAILFAANGMNTEAQTLVRSVYEAAFWIGYLHEATESARNDFFSDAIKNEIKVREIALRGFMQPAQAVETQKQIDDLKIASEKYPKQPPNIRTVAERSGLTERYAEYRLLCGKAAHTSLGSIVQYVSVEEDGTYKGHIIGPDESQIPETMGFSMAAAMMTIEAFRRLTKCADFDVEFGSLLDRYSHLMETGFKS